ncbi:MAG: VOC family protein [Fimbriimonadaceae bacterium]|nr:VOC family protein [Fimbriimonadaceae bacterium]
MTMVHHLALNCRDRAAVEAFYSHFFGFRRARVFHAGQPNEFVMLRCGGTCLELFDGPPEGSGGEQPVGFKHLAFEIDDLDARHAALTAAGHQPGALIDCGALVPGLRICFLRDPDGNIVELLEGWSDEG